MICTKTLYNYIDLGFIKIKNSYLPMKLRINKRKNIVRVNRIKLGRSIEERDKKIGTIEEFGHWEIDTVEGLKDKKDNGSEFSNLSNIENDCSTNVYFTHPYSSFEKGCNERHNGLIRRFIPKGKDMFQYTIDEISRIENCINTLPRRKLNLILQFREAIAIYKNEYGLSRMREVLDISQTSYYKALRPSYQYS